MNAEFVSGWEKGIQADSFIRRFEKVRTAFEKPLVAAYRSLAAQHFGDSKLLFLGIGTGQFPANIDIESDRVVGIDISQSLLDVARSRLPEAQLYHGAVATILPEMPRFPVTVASDMLDCIKPSELKSLMEELRKKTDKVIAAQIFLPDYEFYASYWPENGFGSHGAPGIEGWPQEYQAYVQTRMEERGIDQRGNDVQMALSNLQSVMEYNFGGYRFSKRLTDLFTLSRFPFGIFPSEYVDGRPYPAYIHALGEVLEIGLNQTRTSDYPYSGTAEDAAKYAALDTAHRLIQLAKGLVQIDYHWLLLEKAARDAGFANVDRLNISAIDSEVVNNDELARQIDLSLQTMNQSLIAPDHIRHAARQCFAGGVPMSFFEPHEKPLNAARVQCLVIS